MATRLYTIGFTKKSARQFFEVLKREGIKRLVDIRLNNRSQLAGFTKKDDLEYFVQAICSASYHHIPSFAPTQEILDGLKKQKGSWSNYEVRFQALMRERGAIENLDRAFFEEPSCLLCSEATPEHCHRRLVAEAIRRRWPEIEIVHQNLRLETAALRRQRKSGCPEGALPLPPGINLPVYERCSGPSACA